MPVQYPAIHPKSSCSDEKPKPKPKPKATRIPRSSRLQTKGTKPSCAPACSDLPSSRVKARARYVPTQVWRPLGSAELSRRARRKKATLTKACLQINVPGGSGARGARAVVAGLDTDQALAQTQVSARAATHWHKSFPPSELDSKQPPSQLQCQL